MLASDDSIIERLFFATMSDGNPPSLRAAPCAGKESRYAYHGQSPVPTSTAVTILWLLIRGGQDLPMEAVA